MTLYKKKEEEARNLYLATLQQKNNFLQQLQALDNFRGIYSSELTNKGMQAPIQHGTYEHYISFIKRLDNISAEQLAGLKKIESEVEKRLNQYKEIEAKRKGLEMLMKKRALEAEAKIAKQEQKLSDDLATNKFFQSSQQKSDN